MAHLSGPVPRPDVTRRSPLCSLGWWVPGAAPQTEATGPFAPGESAWTTPIVAGLQVAKSGLEWT